MSILAPLQPPPSTDRPDPARGWIVAGSVVLLLLPLYHLVPAAGNAALLAEGGAATTRLVLSAIALLWAAARTGLHPRLRASLKIIGVTSCVSTVMAVLFTATRVTGFPGPPEIFYRLWSLASFGLLLAAILRMPMSPPLGRPEGWTFPLDALISVGGWVAVSWTLMAGPQFAPGPPGASPHPPLAFVATSTLVLAMLNLLTLRGRALPSERAFFLFLLGQSSHLVSLFLGSLDSGDGRLLPWADLAYYGGAVPLLWSAWAMRRDPIPEQGAESSMQWIREFNPFALVMPLVTSAALLHVLRNGPAADVWPLASATAAVSVLLALRLGITIVVSRRQMRAEAAREARLQAERLEALRRVAGGVAHSFNNSLTVILGQADLGLMSASEPEAGESFARIREAGERSANLTRHLLWYTGRQHQQREALRTGAWLRSLEPELHALAAHGVSVTLAAPDVTGTITGDAAQLAAAVLELTRNAIASMPDGGPVLVSLDACRAGDAPAGGPAGSCHRINVSDSGRGIGAEHLSRLFEPFYSAGASMPDSGMGLAVAHGVVRAHGGIIAVESAPGRGSTFRVILPADATD